MAIEETSTVDQITVIENGSVLYRTATQILENGKLLAETFHRSSLTPGQDVGSEPENVQMICAAVWTPEVVAAYEASLAAVM